MIGLFVAACGTDGDGQAPAAPSGADELLVHELERLTFVPAGRTALGSPIAIGNDVDLLVDRFEMSVGEWRRLFPEGDRVPGAFLAEPPGDAGLYPAAWYRDVPVVGVTLEDARYAAALRGMRVPTYEEWMWCAVGARSRRVPAGRLQRGLANTVDLGLGRTTPVGAFESGQTEDTGVYDLLGNVWEWVEPPLPTRTWSALNTDAWPEVGGRSAPTWVVGGSYATPPRRIFDLDGTILAMATTMGHRSSSVGFRCVANAPDYLRGLARQAGSGDLDAPLRRRVFAVGRAWGLRATPLLETIVDETGGGEVVGILLDGSKG